MLHYPVQTDVVIFLRHLVMSLQAFAKAHSVALTFESEHPFLNLNHYPESIATDLVQLICRIVTFTPQNHSVRLTATLHDSPPNHCFLKIRIENTGVNLSRISEITVQTRQPVAVRSEQPKSTLFEIQWQLEKPLVTTAVQPSTAPHPPDDVRRFYASVRSRMSLHLQKQMNPMAVLAEKDPKGAVFLQKIIAVIEVHMNDEKFDIQQLAHFMAMSRMQLHRKLKPLVNQAPARYIRDLRLAKAKKLIENEDLSIGEICFRVGFQSQSHFTRVFIEKYGVRPTAYRKGK